MNKGLIAAGVGAVVVVGLAVAGVFPKRGWGFQQKGKKQIPVVLRQPSPGSPCVIDPIPDVLGGKKNDRLTWRVENRCSTDQYVRFQNFQRWHLTDDDKDPADPATVDPSQPADTIPAGTTRNIEADIKKDPEHWPWFDTYKYDVYLGANAGTATRVLDPDVEIWP